MVVTQLLVAINMKNTQENKKDSKIWKLLNSAIGIWLLTSVVGGLGVWQFERYMDERTRTRELTDKYQKLALEYEGRLSQYSAWWWKIRHYEELDSGKVDRQTEVFNECVTPEYLRKSIKILSGTPNFSKDLLSQENNIDCTSLPVFQSVFEEYANRSTIGVLAEMRLINQELFPVTFKIDPEDGAYYPDENVEAYNKSRKILYAINDFLNPDAIVTEKINDFRTFGTRDFRDAFSESFYGFGPAEFWYGDCFAC